MKNIILLTLSILILGIFIKWKTPSIQKPNLVYIIVDQLRAESTGYNGNSDVYTPKLDKIAAKSVNLKNAVSGMPVCTPYRAQLMTGQYPLTTGMFMNDVMLDTNMTTIAKVFKSNGYSTGFIGKWHIDGHGRESYIPETRHQGFDYWKSLECTHEYNKSPFYEGNSNKKQMWNGYDALAQSSDAVAYIHNQSKNNKPFILFVSMGSPHDPYQTAPEKYRNIYKDKKIKLNSNVPLAIREQIENNLKGYYSHISALDDAIGEIWDAIQKEGLGENTIFVFTSDHGDLMGAHGQINKQQPYNESIKIPFIISYPAKFGSTGKNSDVLLNTPDIMPTLLGLSNLKIPKSVEGTDLSKIIEGKTKDNTKSVLLSCVQPFGQWSRKLGGREYRGVFTGRFTYVKDLKGPWLLFDNLKDPYQMNNLVSDLKYKKLKEDLEKTLKNLLAKNNDHFLPGMEYVKKWNYVIDSSETIPFDKINFQGKPIFE